VTCVNYKSVSFFLHHSEGVLSPQDGEKGKRKKKPPIQLPLREKAPKGQMKEIIEKMIQKG